MSCFGTICKFIGGLCSDGWKCELHDVGNCCNTDNKRYTISKSLSNLKEKTLNIKDRVVRAFSFLF